MSENNFKTIRQFFTDAKRFVIPHYQRGYKWGVPDKAAEKTSNGKASSAVEVLMHDLIKAFQHKRKSYFLQGITVSEQQQDTTLIDGQQRITTLFLLLNQLNRRDEYLVQKGGLKLRYDVRHETQLFLQRLFGLDAGTPATALDEDVQDIYYLKTANESIQRSLVGVDQDKFTQFVLDNVLLLYIKIDHDKAVKTFTMMNGQKATMKPEELIKAELLRLVSVPRQETIAKPTTLESVVLSLRETVAIEWDINALRSKYAREWDKWLYWWNRKEVSGFFKTGEKPMGLLLEYFYELNKQKDSGTNQNQKESFDFDTFKKHYLEGNSTTAKATFAGLRKLQKTFEDLFDNPKYYNALGVVLNIKLGNERKDALLHLLKHGKSGTDRATSLAEYARWVLVDASHAQIMDDAIEKTSKKEKAAKVLKMLSGKYVYADGNDEDTDLREVKEHAYRQLLWLNIKEDTSIGRKFDFSIWHSRSLEHIHPKSKRAELNFTPYPSCSVHCIGNLVLLYGSNNSEFGKKDVADKKRVYFNLNNEFKSRHLLHTISVFATDNWDASQIYENQQKFTASYKKEYGIDDKAA